MALFNITELLAALPAGRRLIGLDPGRRRIGVALSDVGRRLASPYGVLIRGKLRTTAAEIAGIATAQGAGGLVIGCPLDDDGRLGPAGQAARDWAHALSAATGLPVAMQDETMTTAAAQEQLLESDVSRSRRIAVIDKMAAALILQAALDAAHMRWT